MQTRTEKELLEVMLTNIHILKGGLCFFNDQLYSRRLITDDEHAIIHKYIKNNRPSKFSSLNALWCSNTRWYWTRGTVKHRIKWLKHHIKKLS
jgi:hypothetical protein